MPSLRSLVLSRRALRPRLAVVLALAVLVSLTVACRPVKKSGPPSPPGPPSQYCYPEVPANAPQLQDAFNEFRLANTGLFVAADGSIPFRLPDGRVLWAFGDTLVGLRKPGEPVNPLLGFMSNTFVIQEGRCFRPWYQPIPNPDSGQWIWPNDAIIRNNNELLVFGSHMQGQFGDFDFLSIDVARFSLPDLAFLGSAPLPVPSGTPMGEPARPNYGENVTVDGGFVYTYGRVRQSGIAVDHHFAARVPVNQVLTGTGWEFWDDDDPLLVGDEGWVTDPAMTDPMLFDGSDPLDVTDIGEGPVAPLPVSKLAAPNAYLGSALNFDAFDVHLQTWDGDGPTGPWFLRTPDAVNIAFSKTGPCPIAYGGQVILDLSGVAPFALWSLNQSTLDSGPCGPYPSGFDAVLANPDLYKAFFAVPASGSIP